MRDSKSLSTKAEILQANIITIQIQISELKQKQGNLVEVPNMNKGRQRPNTLAAKLGLKSHDVASALVALFPKRSVWSKALVTRHWGAISNHLSSDLEDQIQGLEAQVKSLKLELRKLEKRIKEHQERNWAPIIINTKKEKDAPRGLDNACSASNDKETPWTAPDLSVSPREFVKMNNLDEEKFMTAMQICGKVGSKALRAKQWQSLVDDGKVQEEYTKLFTQASVVRMTEKEKKMTVLERRERSILGDILVAESKKMDLERLIARIPSALPGSYKKGRGTIARVAKDAGIPKYILDLVVGNFAPNHQDFSEKFWKKNWANLVKGIEEVLFDEIMDLEEEIALLDKKRGSTLRRIEDKNDRHWKPIVLVLGKKDLARKEQAQNVPWGTTSDKLGKALFECQRRLSDGRLAWDPSESFVELAKDAGLLLNKYNRPVVPAYGGDNEEEVIPGLPLWTMIDASGEVHEALLPKGALEVDSIIDLKETMVSLIKEGKAPFLAAKKLWTGPAHIFDVFGGDGARIYAAMGSTNARGAYVTTRRDVQTFVVNLSDPESIKALAKKHPKAFKNLPRFLKWMGDGNAEVDGMSLAGKNAMPGKSEACQMRALAVHTPEKIAEYEASNKRFADAIASSVSETSSPDHVIKIYNNSVDEALAEVEANDDGSLKVRYAKGMLVKSSWLDKKTILLDLNALKGRNKKAIKDQVKEDGFWQANDLVIGLLQDIGTGSMGMSWQAIMYFLRKLPEDFPVKWNWNGQEISMANHFGFGPAQMRAAKLLNKSLDMFNKGLVDDTMSKIFNMVLEDELLHGEKISDRLTVGLWNNVIVRSETSKWIMNFLRKNKYIFQTEGMSKIDAILPLKKYILDMNSLPSDEERTSIHLHDGKTHEAVVGFMQDPEFWDKLGVDEIPVVMFKHPVSDFRVIDVAILKNPNTNGWEDLAPGLWFNSRVTKELLTGDTDGDTAGVFPLWTPLSKNEDGSYSIDTTKEDYSCLYSVVEREVILDEEPTNVERYLEKIVEEPIVPHLGAAEELMAQSGKMVGSAALLQSQVVRLHDLYLTGRLTVARRQNQGLLDDMVKTILKPLRQEVAALLEMSINLQKKNVKDAICEALSKATFGNNDINEEMFKDLVMVIVNGTTNDRIPVVVQQTKMALANRQITEFAGNWGTAACKLIREMIENFDIVVLDKDGALSPIRYASDVSSSRFADQMKDEDPEMNFGTHDNLNWGILPESGLQDALAVWSRTFNGIARKLKARVLKLTQEARFTIDAESGDIEELSPKKSFDPVMVTNANRCVSNSHWRHIVPNRDLTDNELDHLAKMYPAKIMWSTLGLKIKWGRRIDDDIRNNDNMSKAFEYGCKTKNSATSFLAWIVAHGLSNPAKKITCPAFVQAFKWLFDEAARTSFDIDEAKERAGQWVARLRKRMAESCQEYQVEWTLRHMTKEFRDEFFAILEDTAVLLFLMSAGISVRYYFGAAKADENEKVIAENHGLHDESVKALALITFIDNEWIPSEDDFRNVLAEIKNVRGNMNDEKKIWRETTKKLLNKCTVDLRLQCWRIAYDKPVLMEVMRRSWIFMQEVNRIADSNGVQYFFAAWGFDAMREHGLTKTNVMGKGGLENPRVPILINKDLWNEDGMQLRPVPMCRNSEDNPVLFNVNGQSQEVRRDMHATGLVNEDGLLVAILCEPLNIMRLILAFDNVAITRNKLTEAELGKKAMFRPVTKWWQNEVDGEWTRHLCRIRAFNDKVSGIVAASLLEADLESSIPMKSALRGQSLPKKTSYEIVRYESGAIRSLKKPGFMSQLLALFS